MQGTFISTNAITKNQAGSYSATTLDCEFTVSRSGSVLARERYRVTRSGDSWSSTVSVLSTNAVNAGQLSATGSVADNAITVTCTWNQDNSQATATFFIIVEGADGADGAPGPQGAAGVTTSNTQPYMSWSSGDNGSNWSPSGTQSSVVTFKQGSTTLASTTITGTLNTSTGNVTMSSGSTSGSPTISFSGNGTSSASATITKNNAEAQVTAFALNLGDLGGK